MLVSIAQLTSTSKVADNLQKCLALIQEAASNGAKAIFLPEASDYISNRVKTDFLDHIKEISIQCNIAVSIGLHESANDDKFYNTHYCADV
jgi:predicted amidohydrolase